MSRRRAVLSVSPQVSRAAFGAATFRSKSENSKLSPVIHERLEKGLRIRAAPPFCCSTYVSIAATCDDSCSYKNNGCYVGTHAELNLGPLRPLHQAIPELAETTVSNDAA
jgi:hypothetical protein